jgi:hypothetical protein
LVIRTRTALLTTVPLTLYQLKPHQPLYQQTSVALLLKHLSVPLDISLPDVSYSGPRLLCTIQDHDAHALVDTGSAITAISSRIFSQLSATLDSSSAIQFATANGSSSASLGTTNLSITIDHHTVNLDFHVIENLSQDIIIGYPDLRRLSAAIDTVSNTVTFKPGNDRIRMNPSSVTAVNSLRLPLQSHA